MALSTLWIGDEDEQYKMGQVGFLVEISPQDGADRYRLQEHPARTNRSNEPRLRGWCGETDNINIYARGIVRVTRVARNGRALVAGLSPSEETAALNELGYPELDETGARPHV